MGSAEDVQNTEMMYCPTDARLEELLEGKRGNSVPSTDMMEI